MILDYRNTPIPKRLPDHARETQLIIKLAHDFAAADVTAATLTVRKQIDGELLYTINSADDPGQFALATDNEITVTVNKTDTEYIDPGDWRIGVTIESSDDKSKPLNACYRLVGSPPDAGGGQLATTDKDALQAEIDAEAAKVLALQSEMITALATVSEVNAARSAGIVGAPATTISERIEWLESAISPLAFGAVADGTTNPASDVYANAAAVQAAYPLTQALHASSATLTDIDTTTELDYLALQEAIQTAKASGAVISLPLSKKFFIGTGSLWCGHETDPNKALKGFYGNNCTLIAGASTAMVDWTGSRRKFMTDVIFNDDGTSEPEIGILASRIDAATPKSTGHGVFSGLEMLADFSVAAVYNITDESNTWQQCRFTTYSDSAVAGYVATWTNEHNITSHFTTVVDTSVNSTTFSFQTFVACNFSHRGSTATATAAALYLGSITNFNFVACLFDRGTAGALVRFREETGIRQPSNFSFYSPLWHAQEFTISIILDADTQVNGLTVIGGQGRDYDGGAGPVDIDLRADNAYLRDAQLQVNSIICAGVGSRIYGNSTIRVRNSNEEVHFDLSAASGAFVEAEIYTLSTGTLILPSATSNKKARIIHVDTGYQFSFGDIPTATPGTAIGSNGTATIAATNMREFRVTFNPSGSGVGAGEAANITFNPPLPYTPYSIALTPLNAASGSTGLQWYAQSLSSSGFSLRVSGSLATSTTYIVSVKL